MTISKVFMICNAYESGYGHGYEQDKLCNPFAQGTDEYEAYSLGYHEGFGNRQNTPSKTKHFSCECGWLHKNVCSGFKCHNCGRIFES